MRAVIERDLREALKRDDEARKRGDSYKPLGMDMDRAEWLRVLAMIDSSRAPWRLGGEAVNLQTIIEYLRDLSCSWTHGGGHIMRDPLGRIHGRRPHSAAGARALDFSDRCLFM